MIIRPHMNEARERDRIRVTIATAHSTQHSRRSLGLFTNKNRARERRESTVPRRRSVSKRSYSQTETAPAGLRTAFELGAFERRPPTLHRRAELIEDAHLASLFCLLPSAGRSKLPCKDDKVDDLPHENDEGHAKDAGVVARGEVHAALLQCRASKARQRRGY